MATKDGLKGQYVPPEPTPPVPPEPLGRRAHDQYAGERIARMEEKLGNVEASVDRLDIAIVKVHERIDELNNKFTDFANNVHSRVSDVVQDVERSLDSHVAEEEKLFLARFESISEKIDRVADRADMRGLEAAEGIKGLRSMGVAVITAIVGITIPIIGWVISFLVDKGPMIVLLVDKLERLK